MRGCIGGWLVCWSVGWMDGWMDGLMRGGIEETWIYGVNNPFLLLLLLLLDFMFDSQHVQMTLLAQGRLKINVIVAVQQHRMCLIDRRRK